MGALTFSRLYGALRDKDLDDDKIMEISTQVGGDNMARVMLLLRKEDDAAMAPSGR